MRELWIPQVEWSRAGRLALVWMLWKDIKKTATIYRRKLATRNQSCKSCHHSTFVSFINLWRIGSLTLTRLTHSANDRLTQLRLSAHILNHLIYLTIHFYGVEDSNFSFRVFLKSVSELSFRRRGRLCTLAKLIASLNNWLFNEVISFARVQSLPRRLEIVDCWHLHGSIALL